MLKWSNDWSMPSIGSPVSAAHVHAKYSHSIGGLVTPRPMFLCADVDSASLNFLCWLWLMICNVVCSKRGKREKFQSLRRWYTFKLLIACKTKAMWIALQWEWVKMGQFEFNYLNSRLKESSVSASWKHFSLTGFDRHKKDLILKILTQSFICQKEIGKNNSCFCCWLTFFKIHGKVFFWSTVDHAHTIEQLQWDVRFGVQDRIKI